MTQYGVYLGSDPSVSNTYEAWAGQQPNDYLNYLNNSSWSGFDSSVGWAVGLWKNVPTVWSVPLTVTGTSLETVASGAENAHFLAAAQQLAQTTPSADGNIYVRLGWEFNGSWMPWSAQGHEQAFIQAFQDVVDIFRSVGSNFKFVWDVNEGYSTINPATAYPGDNYVDVVGMDTYYDTSYNSANAAQAFQDKVNEQYGLQWQQTFAAAHGKSTAISEWGVNSDQAGPFIQDMAQWLTAHNMVYANYWNSNASFNGVLSTGQFPDAGAAYKAAFTSQATGAAGTTNSTGAASATLDTLVIRVSGDSWQGNPHFIVTVDGQQVGGTLTTAASHAAGQTEDITLTGSFGSGSGFHAVSVQFIDDAYGGSATADRNLYINEITLDGRSYAGDAADNPLGLSNNGVAELTGDTSVTFNTYTTAAPTTIIADQADTSVVWYYPNGSTIDFQGDHLLASTFQLVGDPTFFVDQGQLEIVSGDIVDAVSSNPGMLEKTGTGTLILGGANTFSGGTVFSEGILDLASLHAAGTGSVTFGAGAQTLIVEHNALSGAGELTNFIIGFASDGDVIDVRGIGQDAVAHFDYSTDTLTLSSASGTETLATLHFSGDFTADSFAAGSDGLGGTAITLSAALPITLATVDDNVTGHATGHDLFGNGSADQVIQSNTGGLLTMFALSSSGGLTQIGQVGADWSVAGSGDLDGNGRSDLIMQHDVDGLRDIYSFSMGTSQVTAINKIGTFGTDWQVDGTGDFNGDGFEDILIERSAGGTKELDILGVKNGAVSSVNVAGVLPATYQVDGTGDMNGDSKDDILVHYDDASGRHFIELDQANYTTQALKGVATIGTEWQALGLGDFNHDGFKDILIERDTGTAQDLGILVNQGGHGWVFKDLGPILGRNVKIDGIGDFNGDGTADISAHYDAASGTRTNIYLEMHDAAVAAIHTTGTVGHDWMLA